jgi:hypothetical protein
MRLACRQRRPRKAKGQGPQQPTTPDATPLHGRACLCWVCGYTRLLPTYPLSRPFTQRLSD